MLNGQEEKKVKELVEICKKYQGEYRLADHGSGSWATTYSNEFISAATQIYDIYKQAGSPSPMWRLSQALRNAGVRSCRGAEMNIDKTKYLYETHLRENLS